MKNKSSTVLYNRNILKRKIQSLHLSASKNESHPNNNNNAKIMVKIRKRLSQVKSQRRKCFKHIKHLSYKWFGESSWTVLSYFEVFMEASVSQMLLHHIAYLWVHSLASLLYLKNKEDVIKEYQFSIGESTGQVVNPSNSLLSVWFVDVCNVRDQWIIWIWVT